MTKTFLMPFVPILHLSEVQRARPAALVAEVEGVERYFLAVSGSALDPSKVVARVCSALQCSTWMMKNRRALLIGLCLSVCSVGSRRNADLWRRELMRSSLASSLGLPIPARHHSSDLS